MDGMGGLPFDLNSPDFISKLAQLKNDPQAIQALAQSGVDPNAILMQHQQQQSALPPYYAAGSTPVENAPAAPGGMTIGQALTGAATGLSVARPPAYQAINPGHGPSVGGGLNAKLNVNPFATPPQPNIGRLLVR